MDLLQTMNDIAMTHGYLFIFLIMVVEGPTITAAAGFAASLGYLNIWAVILLSMAGDLLGDIVHFTIGRSVGSRAIARFGATLGVSEEILQKIRGRLDTHFNKTIVAIKMTPIAGLGLIVAGSLRPSWGRFLKIAALVIVPRAIGFALLGYLFGWALEKILHVFAIAEYALLGLLVLVGIFWFSYRALGKKMLREVNDSDDASSRSGTRP